MALNQPGSLEAIVRTCIESAAAKKQLPGVVTRRLIALVEDIASGELDPTDRPSVERRIDVMLRGFDVVS